MQAFEPIIAITQTRLANERNKPTFAYSPIFALTLFHFKALITAHKKGAYIGAFK